MLFFAIQKFQFSSFLLRLLKQHTSGVEYKKLGALGRAGALDYAGVFSLLRRDRQKAKESPARMSPVFTFIYYYMLERIGIIFLISPISSYINVR